MAGMELVPEEHKDLLKDEKKAFAHLATVMPDGSPQVTPIWFNIDGDYILFNSAVGRVKDRNIRKFPGIALAITDPEDPYRYLQIRGEVTEITTKGAREHINALSSKYTGNAEYPVPSSEQRVIYKVMPQSVSVMG